MIAPGAAIALGITAALTCLALGGWLGWEVGTRGVFRHAFARMTGAERDAFLGMLEREPLAPEEVTTCRPTPSSS